MTYFAVLNGNNLVTNTIIADTKENAELATMTTCIEFTAKNPAGIGYTWDGINFLAPEPEVTND